MWRASFGSCAPGGGHAQTSTCVTASSTASRDGCSEERTHSGCAPRARPGVSSQACTLRSSQTRYGSGAAAPQTCAAHGSATAAAARGRTSVGTYGPAQGYFQKRLISRYSISQIDVKLKWQGGPPGPCLPLCPPGVPLGVCGRARATVLGLCDLPKGLTSSTRLARVYSSAGCRSTNAFTARVNKRGSAPAREQPREGK
jgi:hypothetical protein